jgi:outer membrane autotransporter protein
MSAALMASHKQNLTFAPFGVIGGGTIRHDTGSHIDVDGLSLLAGFAWRAPLKPQSGSFLLGVFIEGGWGNYDSYNSFHSLPSVHGKGDTSYYGGGILGRYGKEIGPGDVYGEASLRAGRVDTDFRSRDILNSGGTTTKYDSDSNYYGAHVGGGYLWKITDKASLDFSARYIWTRQGSDGVIISGDRVAFSAMNSHRVRAGARGSFAVNSYFTPYGGLYYEHEFSGKAKAAVNGVAINSPSLHGGTGVGEAGIVFHPAKDLLLFLDLGIQGYVGKREGVTGSLQVKYEF